MVVVSTVFLIVSAAVAGIFFMAPSDDNAAASFLHSQPGSRHWDERTPVTALLIGASTPGQPANSFTIVSVDPQSRSLHMLSIPPNLWVTIPGFGQGRVVDSYADGGPSLALLTVQSMTHIAIPYYVVVRRAPFENLIDSLGSIPLRVPHGLRVSHYPAVAESGFVNIRIKRGLQHLTGARALDYVRVITPASGGIQAAMVRQQSVLVAVLEDAVSQRNFFRIPTLITNLGGGFPTNFPYSQIPALANVLTHIPRSTIRSDRLDSANQAVTQYAGNHANVLVPDWYHVRLVVRRLFPRQALLGGPGVIVLNGSNVVGQAASLTTWLSLGGVRVARYATAPTTSNRTVVEMPRGASGAEQDLATSLSTLLQAPIVDARDNNPIRRVTIIIGNNYQDLTQQ